ncbi:MAG: hypothetical protein NTX77_00510 [Actinobacteria bacterium]|nr:hypothetical protein [Actinomycetota bacterium]
MGSCRDSRQADSGQAVMLALLAVSLLMALALGVARLAVGFAQAGLAQNAADAAALAATTAGAVKAAHVAQLNGARLLSYSRVDNDEASTVTVIVEVAGHRATARATDGP